MYPEEVFGWQQFIYSMHGDVGYYYFYSPCEFAFLYLDRATSGGSTYLYKIPKAKLKDDIIVEYYLTKDGGHAWPGVATMKSQHSRLQKYRELKSTSNTKDKELEKILTRDPYKFYRQKKRDMKDEIYHNIQKRRTQIK
jgi:hypothetical protein